MIRRVVFVCPTPGCHGGCYGTFRDERGIDMGRCQADDEGPGTYISDGTPPAWRPVPCSFTWPRALDWLYFRVVLQAQDETEYRDMQGDELCWPPLPRDEQGRHEAAERKALEWMQRAGAWKP